MVSDLWGKDFVPLGSDEEEDPVGCPVQRHSADEQSDQNDVREDGREISGFARRGHTFHQYEGDDDPGEQQTQGQSPFRNSDAIVDVDDFLEHVVAVTPMQMCH